ncbi:hypothetical protein [Streptomyces griseoluteus]|uniref:hypothetical protein n=1 Tax=Streptomyces griseoluteus TaxID=29306 RepID=UPI00382C72FE
MNGNNASNRGVWLAIILLASLCVAVTAGAIFYLLGAQPAAALGVGGAAFMGSTSLGLAAHRFLTE